MTVWPIKCVAGASRKKRHFRMLSLRVSPFFWFLDGPSADTLIVESVPTTQHPVCKAVGLTKLVTLLKRIAARGRGVSHQMTCPHVHKVAQVMSPLLEVPTAAPPVAGPSRMTQLPLFKEQALSGGEGVGPGVPTSSGV